MIDPLGKRLLDWRIKKTLPHISGRLLDVGCGTNDLVKRYGRDKGVGVDVYPWDGVDRVVENTAHLPYEDGSFDTVTILAALNHIPNRKEVLQDIHRVLAPDGQFIMTMIPRGIGTVWHKLREPWDHDQHERGMEEGETFGLAKQEILKLLEETGYEIVTMERFMLGINNLYIARKKQD
jgi:ubiquinone/menaquinone biosynthesis C-methylase UbiE